ncbi:MAG: Rv3235 family protein [Marmoricola sp.]
MTCTTPADRGSGVTHLARIGPPALPVAPMATTQGTLALDFGTPRPVPRRPDLRAVAGLRAELDAFASRFSAVLVEVLGGDRGPQQLLRWTSEEVYSDLVRRSRALAGTTGSDERLRRLRAQVRSVHLFCPSPEAAELSIHVRHGHRSRAIAARLEHRGQRWICVALQLG